MAANKAEIHNWRYSESKGDDDIPTGWRCMIYASECHFDIDNWMEQVMTGYYECDFRFNSGQPIYTIYIKEQRDAEYFLLALQ